MEYLAENQHRIPLAHSTQQSGELGSVIYLDGTGVNFAVNSPSSPWQENDGILFSGLTLLDFDEGEDKEEIIAQLAKFMSPQDLLAHIRKRLI